MENLRGKYLVVATVLSLVVTLTSAAVGDKTCNTNADCTGGDPAIPNSVCNAEKKCECATAFKEVSGACLAKGLGDPCQAEADCTAGVTDSTCSAQKKCECKTDFTAINNMCKIGLGNTCTNDASCSAVDNAECPAGTLKCACKANYKEENGHCSKAIGLQTLLSAPGALLLSFLTIVVTRLH